MESAQNAEKQLSDAKAELTQCLSVNEELRRKAEDAERAVANAAADAEEKERLCAQLDAARSAIDEVNEKLRDTTAENDDLRKQLEDLAESQRSHNEERARLENDLAAALNRESDLAARAEELGRREDDAGESMHNVAATEAIKGMGRTAQFYAVIEN
jgi:chromosome segregation ATPase